MLLFYLLPLIGSARYSLLDSAFTQRFVGLEQYCAVLANRNFRVGVFNTVVLAALCVPALLAFSLPLSLFVQRHGTALPALRVALLMPMLLPSAAVTDAFQKFPLGGARGVLFAIYLWKHAGFSTLVFLAALSSVPGRAVRSRSAGRSRERDTFLSHYVGPPSPGSWDSSRCWRPLTTAPVSGSLSAVRQLSRRRRVPVATLYEQPFCPAGISRSNRCRAAVFRCAACARCPGRDPPGKEAHAMRKIRLSKVGAALIVALFLLPPAMIVLSSFMSDRDLDKIYADGAAFCPIPREATLSGYWELLFASQAYLATFWNSLGIAPLCHGAQRGGFARGRICARPRALSGARMPEVLLWIRHVAALSGHIVASIPARPCSPSIQYLVGAAPARRVCAHGRQFC